MFGYDKGRLHKTRADTHHGRPAPLAESVECRWPSPTVLLRDSKIVLFPTHKKTAVLALISNYNEITTHIRFGVVFCERLGTFLSRKTSTLISVVISKRFDF